MVPFVTSDRILLIAPHPDDETLGAGGLLQRAFASNASVRILFGTNGEDNPWAQRYWERRWNIRAADRARWGARRRLEAKRAISVLGGSPDWAVFLNLPDQGVTRLLVEGNQALASRFSVEICEWQPTLLVMPIHLDAHPDHSAFSVILLMALDAIDARSIKVLQYLVHEPCEPVCCQAISLGLTLEEVERKRQAILCHETQMALSRHRFLRFARAEEVYFPRIAREAPLGARPAVTARFQEGFLRLSLRASGRTRSGSEVLLVFRSDAGRAFLWRIPIGFTSGVARVWDDLARDSLHEASVTWNGLHLSVDIPSPKIGDISAMFVKLKEKTLFFDRSGWHEVGALLNGCSHRKISWHDPGLINVSKG